MKTKGFLLIVAITLVGFLFAPGVSHAEAQSGPVIHQVQRGETLADIAARYGVTVDQLIELNNLREGNRLYTNMRLVVKPAPHPADATKYYVVKKGDTMMGIARKFGTSVAAIQDANNLNGTVIYVGQLLKIPVPEKKQPANEAQPAKKKSVVHVVRKGETLESIARKYGTTVLELRRLNDLKKNAILRVGQKLVISGEANKPAKRTARGKKRFVVDISEQRCWRYEGDTLLNTWRCSTGRNNSTKVGKFRVQSKIRKAYGSTWNIWMPWWLGIYWVGPVENGIHGQPWNAKTGRRTWAGLVGTPITYGCVMLNDKAAKTLWEWADIGTTVIIKR
jgi:LysM repeat protein